jgi:NADH-quinone oxidoreductase subunit I
MSTLLTQTKSLFNSLFIAFRHIFNKAVTVQYPYQKPVTAPLYRGALALGIDESGKDICIACDACAKVCPSSCIRIESHKGEGKGRVLDVFDIDMTKCCFCGFCEEICPTEPVAIKLTSLYEYATNNRKQIDVVKGELYETYTMMDLPRIVPVKETAPKAASPKEAAPKQTAAEGASA